MSESWKDYQHLKQKRQREKDKLYLVEGVRLCRDALHSGQEVKTAFVGESFLKNDAFPEMEALLKREDIFWRAISDSNLKKLADTEHPQGIVLILSIPEAAADINSRIDDKEILLVLDGIRDPGNMGAILRCADWFGVPLVISSPDSVDFYNPKVVRSSMGSLFHIDTAEVPDLEAALQLVKNAGFLVAGTTLRDGTFVNEFNTGRPIAVIIGNEASGISNELITMTDILLQIPKLGRAESLNAAVATGIILNELVIRQNKVRRS